MSNPVILLSSVTYAIRAQKLLDQRGIRSYLKKVPNQVQNTGCGYGLEVKGNVQAALDILSAANLRVVSVLGI